MNQMDLVDRPSDPEPALPPAVPEAPEPAVDEPPVPGSPAPVREPGDPSPAIA